MQTLNQRARDALSSIDDYTADQLHNILVRSMVDGVRRMDAAPLGEEWRVLTACLDEYEQALYQLMVDALGKYQSAAISDSSALLGPDPCRLVKLRIERNIIRSGSRLVWAWMYWVLHGHPDGYPGCLPISPENFVGRDFQLPEWMDSPVPAGAEKITVRDHVRSKMTTIRAGLRLDLQGEMLKVAVAINTAKLAASSPQTPAPSMIGASAAKRRKRERDAAILTIWPPSKKGGIHYSYVCSELDRQEIPAPDKWRKGTWIENYYDDEIKGARAKVVKYIHDVIRPSRDKIKHCASRTIPKGVSIQ